MPKEDVINALPRQLQEAGKRADQVLKQAAEAEERYPNPTLKELHQAVQGLRHQVYQIWDQALIAIEQVEQLQHLIKTATLVNSSLEIEFVLDTVLDTIIDLTGAENAMIFLYPIDGTELELHVARTWEHDKLEMEDVRVSWGIIQTAIEKKHPIMASDASSDSRFDKRESVVQNQLRSIIAIPLVIRENVIGVMYGDNNVTRGVFNADNYDLLVAFANQSATAISNARLYDQVRRYLRETHHELTRLQIEEIDQESVEQRVEQITSTQLFKTLQKFVQENKKEEEEEE